MEFLKNVHGGNIYKYARDTGIDKTEIIDFSANINPLGMSPKGLMALKAALPEVINYPDPDNFQLKHVIADTYKVPFENIVVGNGAAEIIYGVCRFSGYKRVVVTGPAFSEYKKAATVANLPLEIIVTNEQNDFEITADLLFAHKELLNGSILFLGNPNNPDGNVLHEGEKILELTKDLHCLVVVDESFIDFLPEQASYRGYLSRYEHLIIIHSYTKFYAVPGLRLGAAYMSTENAVFLQKILPAWSLNHLSAGYGVAALQDKEYIESTKNFMSAEKERIYGLYKNQTSIRVLEPQANFMLLHLEKDRVSLEELQDYLWQQHILIRSCETYEGLGKNWFRIAIKKREENNRLFLLLKEFLENE